MIRSKCNNSCSVYGRRKGMINKPTSRQAFSTNNLLCVHNCDTNIYVIRLNPLDFIGEKENSQFPKVTGTLPPLPTHSLSEIVRRRKSSGVCFVVGVLELYTLVLGGGSNQTNFILQFFVHAFSVHSSYRIFSSHVLKWAFFSFEVFLSLCLFKCVCMLYEKMGVRGYEYVSINVFMQFYFL